MGKRSIVIGVAAAVAVTLTLTAGVAGAKSGGNSANAKKCQGTGYLNWTTTSGTTFGSADACTAYAAHGGVLVAATHNLRVLVLNESPRFLATVEVTSDPAGIDCVQPPEGLNTCNHEFTAGTTVTLTEMPGPGALPPGATFFGWQGDCSGTQPTCTVTMDSDHTVGASFD